MRKLAIITDSTSYFTKEYLQKHSIEVASLHVVVDGVSYEEVDVDNEFVFDNLNNKKKVSTAAVAPLVFTELYQKLFDSGVEDILVFLISSGISGTYQSAMIAKDMVDGNVHVYDALVAAYGVENIIIQVANAIESGMERDELLELASTLSKNGHVLFTLTTLDHVVRGGRVSKTSALIGNALKIKPIVEMVEGRLEVTRKSRTNKKIINKFIVEELVEASKKYEMIYLRIISLQKDEITDEIEAKLKENIKNIEITRTSYIGPVFSYHLGDEGYGITWTAK